MSYKELAAQADIPIYTIRRRMSGVTRSFTLDELHKIADALGIGVSRLLWEGGS